MAYDKTWAFTLNQTPAAQDTLQHQCQSFLYFLKSALVTAGWTVVSSSNGASQSAGDLWTASSALTWSAAGNAHSWILLASPVGFVAGPNGSGAGAQSQVYLCLECISGAVVNTAYYNLTFYSTLPTGGTVSSIPTGGNANPVAPSGYTQFINSTLTTAKFQFAATAKGGFYASISYPGTGIDSTLIGCLDLADVQLYGANPFPYAFVGFSYYNNIAANMSYVIFDTVANPNGAVCYSHDGTVGSPRAMVWCVPGTTIIPGSGCSYLGDINGNVLDSPIYIYNNVSGKIASMGRLPDFKVSGISGVNNGSIDNLTTINYTYMNQLLIPSNAGILI